MSVATLPLLKGIQALSPQEKRQQFLYFVYNAIKRGDTFTLSKVIAHYSLTSVEYSYIRKTLVQPCTQKGTYRWLVNLNNDSLIPYIKELSEKLLTLSRERNRNRLSVEQTIEQNINSQFKQQPFKAPIIEKKPIILITPKQKNDEVNDDFINIPLDKRKARVLLIELSQVALEDKFYSLSKELSELIFERLY